MTPHTIASQFFKKPLAILPSALEAIVSAHPAEAEFASEYQDRVHREFGFVDGIAIIPVKGVLGNGVPWWCEGTSYDWIRCGFDAALLADDVKAIVLDVNSPGGLVEGCFDLTDHIFASRGTKPICAILSESAYSAAYAIAGAADKIIVPRTGGTGSIGVVSAHFDVSEMLSKFGVKVTYIQFGERKTDGAAEKPLSGEALERFQADIDAMGELFVNTVARNRDIPAAKVRDTQAATFLGPAGVVAGLADAVMAPDAAFRELLASIA